MGVLYSSRKAPVGQVGTLVCTVDNYITNIRTSIGELSTSLGCYAGFLLDHTYELQVEHREGGLVADARAA